MIELLGKKTALNLLLTQVKKQWGKEFKTCDIELDPNKEDEIIFTIDGQPQTVKEEKLKGIFMSLAEAQTTSENTILDRIIIKTAKGGEYSLNIYVQENGKKLHKKTIL